MKSARRDLSAFWDPAAPAKALTQKLLIRLLKDYQGEILYRGKKLTEYSDEFYQDIGVSFEMPISFSKLTAMENLEFFRRLTSMSGCEPSSRVGLWMPGTRRLENIPRA